MSSSSTNNKSKVNAGIILGSLTTLGCLFLAPLDGGLTAFASLATFKAGLAAGAYTAAEVGASVVVGGTVERLVNGDDTVLKMGTKMI